MKKVLSFVTGAMLLLGCLQVKAQTAIVNLASNSAGSIFSCHGPTTSYSCKLEVPNSNGEFIIFHYQRTNPSTWEGKGTFALSSGDQFSVVWTMAADSKPPVSCGDSYELVGILSQDGQVIGETHQHISAYSGSRGECGVSDNGGTSTID